MPEFIFMLTKDDRTVADASAVYRDVRAEPLRYVGFKDIGRPISVLRDLAAMIRDDGRTPVLEVVSVDRDSELRGTGRGPHVWGSGFSWADAPGRRPAPGGRRRDLVPPVSRSRGGASEPPVGSRPGDRSERRSPVVAARGGWPRSPRLSTSRRRPQTHRRGRPSLAGAGGRGREHRPI